MNISGRTITRFYSKIDQTSTCWLWKGRLTKKGYGQFDLSENGWKTVLAHRFMFELVNSGRVPSQLVVMHKCHNRQCVNPYHLKVGTQSENIQDRENIGTTSKGEHHASKMTTNKVLELRNLYSQGGYTTRDLAKKYDIAPSYVSAIIRREWWKHV